jgi:hypothetical protein
MTKLGTASGSGYLRHSERVSGTSAKPATLEVLRPAEWRGRNGPLTDIRTFSRRRRKFPHLGSHLRRERGVSDRDNCATRASQSFNLGVELMRKRLDDSGAKSGFGLSEDAVRLANTIV